ncbi:ornithine cyclodeaminase family protein [Pararhodobacter oceanensis]|uniref:ornithine cyclodeaminase family protein n=1 Tax=Pararhodobacter oceanensis TaxID=2172121 RepID=UPI003A959934
MIVISAEHVQQHLPMAQAIDLVTATMIDVAEGRAILPLRNVIEIGGDNRIGIMPGALSAGGLYGVKILSLFPGNPAKGLSSHIGAVLLFDPETGVPTALVNADMITAIRTSAASAAATRALAREDATRLSVIGTSEQAEFHIEAITQVRPIAEVHIAGRSHAKAEGFAARMAEKFPALTFHAAPSIQEAALRADILCTVTSATEAILPAGWVQSGTHVNAVGASVPFWQEIDSALIARAVTFVDYMPSALAQAKDVIDGLADGLFEQAHLRGEIGRLFAGQVAGRSSDGEITLYRSLGVAAQDLACADHVQKAARAAGAQDQQL